MSHVKLDVNITQDPHTVIPAPNGQTIPYVHPTTQYRDPNPDPDGSYLIPNTTLHTITSLQDNHDATSVHNFIPTSDPSPTLVGGTGFGRGGLRLCLLYPLPLF